MAPLGVRVCHDSIKTKEQKGETLFGDMRYVYLENVVLSPVAVKGLPEEAWDSVEGTQAVGTSCLVLRDDHSQEGVVIDYVTVRVSSSSWERKLVIYSASREVCEYDENHMWIATWPSVQERFTESWWQIRMAYQVLEHGY
jgi:hypothetical protein